MIFGEIPITMGGMNAEFAQWLQAMLDEKGWSQSEAARRGNISSQMVNAILNGYANPGLDFCRGLARAFGMDLEEVLRHAGILPPAGELPPKVREWGLRLMRLSEPDRNRLIDLMDRLLEELDPGPEPRYRRRS